MKLKEQTIKIKNELTCGNCGELMEQYSQNEYRCRLCDADVFVVKIIQLINEQ